MTIRKFHHKAHEQFEHGLTATQGIVTGVTVFGSARLGPETEDYQRTVALGKALATNGYEVITGGGPALMEAANKGCSKAGGVSIGVGLNGLPGEARNDYQDIELRTDYFFVRKPLISTMSCAYICVKGGLGTLDELFEVLTLISVGKIESAPVILLDVDFWKPIMDMVQQKTVSAGTAGDSSFECLHIVDTVDEAVEIINNRGNA